MDAADTVPIVIPDHFSDAQSCTISVWFVDEGDAVRKNDRLYELLIPGMSIEVEAAVSGTLVKILRHRNATIEAGEIIGWISPHQT